MTAPRLIDYPIYERVVPDPDAVCHLLERGMRGFALCGFDCAGREPHATDPRQAICMCGKPLCEACRVMCEEDGRG